MEGKDFRAAVDALNRYLTVDPQNKDMIAERLDAVTGAARQGAPRSTEGSGSAVPDDATAQSLVEKARDAVQKKDWLAAHYYAQEAVALDPRRVDALAIVSRAEDELAHLTRAEKDVKTANLYKRKSEALARLESGDVTWRVLCIPRDVVGELERPRHHAVPR